MTYLAHAGEFAHYIPAAGAAIPCRVESIGEWLGTNSRVAIRITAPRNAGGYSYRVGLRLERAHGASVRPVAAPAGEDWVWCDGSTHGAPCKRCADVHHVALSVPGRVMSGVWVPGATLVRCRSCGDLLAHRTERATR